ncbi:MAG TPA: imidazole glycerol phosphate synthase subunit HisH [Candidatus Latescibacteria bacterium]|nr:imidazole glycerol phosphate synthase subunit HisH [Candidatus Latescibacterota bacterium]
MSSDRIVIVDYGMGNLRSVQKGFERMGFPVKVSSDPEAVASAGKLVLPGVGAFGDAMEELMERKLVEPILKAIGRGTPFLGICLGLQLLFEESEEGGRHSGLGVLKGWVRQFPEDLLVPQIGWNRVHFVRPSPLFSGVPDGAFFYFVHSYYVDPRDPGDVLARTKYGISYTSAVGRGTVFGVQFHPEKSQQLGLRILANFGGM